jgi:hypothetical protein
MQHPPFDRPERLFGMSVLGEMDLLTGVFLLAAALECVRTATKPDRDGSIMLFVSLAVLTDGIRSEFHSNGWAQSPWTLALWALVLLLLVVSAAKVIVAAAKR